MMGNVEKLIGELLETKENEKVIWTKQDWKLRVAVML